MMTMTMLTIVQTLHLHRMALVKGGVAVLGSALKPTHTGWTREGVRKNLIFKFLLENEAKMMPENNEKRNLGISQPYYGLI